MPRLSAETFHLTCLAWIERRNLELNLDLGALRPWKPRSWVRSQERKLS